MTCIVAITDRACVIMGGDRGGTLGSVRAVIRQSKIHRLPSGMVVGIAGSLRLIEMYSTLTRVPAHPAKVSVYDYLIRRFVPSLRTHFEKHDWLGHSEVGAAENGRDSETLIGYRGEIWRLADDFSVWGRQTAYDAIGSGADVALGSLFATRRTQRPVAMTDRVKLALEAAAEFCVGVTGPFDVVAT